MKCLLLHFTRTLIFTLTQSVIAVTIVGYYYIISIISFIIIIIINVTYLLFYRAVIVSMPPSVQWFLIFYQIVCVSLKVRSYVHIIILYFICSLRSVLLFFIFTSFLFGALETATFFVGFVNFICGLVLLYHFHMLSSLFGERRFFCIYLVCIVQPLSAAVVKYYYIARGSLIY